MEDTTSSFIEQHEAVNKQLSALDVISHLLTDSDFDIYQLLDEIVEVTAEALKVKACTIRLLDEESGELVLKAGYGLSHQYLSKGPVIAAKSAFRQIIESCGKRGEVVEIYDISQDPRVQYSKEAREEGLSSFLASPLLRDDRVIGAISVFTAEPHHFTEREIRTFRTIANQASVAISLAQLYHEQLALKRIEQELAIASGIQAKLMPSRTPELDGIDIAGSTHPCKEVGGDFYDFIELPENNLGIAVGDVSGKGMPAALLMATVRTALRVQAENVYTMSEVIRRVNRTVHQDTGIEEFVTLFYAVLNAQARVLTYVNAGHNSPMLFRGNQVHRLEAGGTAIGILSEMTYTEEIINLLPGDFFVVFTDGFTDAYNDADEQFGEERLIQTLREHQHRTAEEVVQAVEATVRRFVGTSGDYEDDRTIVVLKVH